MVAKVCLCGCGTPLTGRQRSWASEACRKVGSKWVRIKRVYGLTEAEYNKIWKAQGMVCAICGRAPRKGESFHIDHEHQKGQGGPLRGIVCPYDNTRIIGRLKSHKRAQALADYLRTPPATNALGYEVWSPGRPKKKRRKR